MSTGIAISVNGQADRELTQAVTVEINEAAGETGTFKLHYNAEILGGDLPLLIDRRIDAASVVSITVYHDNETLCLIKGPVHGQQITLKHGGTGSALDVRGSDTSVMMDRESKSAVWSDLTDSEAVQSILSTYGYIPDVQNTSAGHFENKHTLIQRESDLSFIRRLARRNGFLFWITCDATGTETAHFRRPQLDGPAAAELVINFDSSNLETLEIVWDMERPTSIEGVQLDLNTKNNLNLSVGAQPPQSLLGDVSLGDITGDTRSVFLSAPADDSGDLTARGEGAAIESGWFINASCKTSPERAGRVIRPCTLVDVRGAGRRHSGTYFVTGVTHTITAGDYNMEIRMIRNGWNQ